ncbi:aminotransferase class V-fold PLP-dependent enzyme [Bradyrhizobium sp. CCBAU 51745]|uniref:aminotransferase class V-fold PLP-dependent enzyme n=1 Tax=Bradyrhizobium sp. CCBAU 51745 TaxID=1325099 RepID=UPI002305B438|nr:aminotransferase class V-fold PLP-dependent enzyme [Bradyrhizobium sp. CCBAU 51745]
MPFYGDPPRRFEAGTQPIAEAIALGAAIDCTADPQAIAYAQEKLADTNFVRVSGTLAEEGPIISFWI